MSVKKVTTNINADDIRLHLDGEEYDARHTGKRAAYSEYLESLKHRAQRVEHIAS